MIEIPPWPSSRTIETKTGQGHASRGLLELGFYVHSRLVQTFVWQADLCLEKVCAAGSTSTGACSFTLCCCTFGKSCLALLLVFCFFSPGLSRMQRIQGHRRGQQQRQPREDRHASSILIALLPLRLAMLSRHGARRDACC